MLELLQGIPTYAVTPSDTPIDRWCADYWSSHGLTPITARDLGSIYVIRQVRTTLEIQAEFKIEVPGEKRSADNRAVKSKTSEVQCRGHENGKTGEEKNK